MYRTSVILRYTFLEAILQPIYPLLLTVGGAILVVFGLLPFFTLGEDTKMFKSVGLDVILILVLLTTLFATSKSIYEEIEDRTMLTLMSKPVRRWEVLTGKYLGIILSAALGVGVLGFILVLLTWYRIPTDYFLNPRTLNDEVYRQILYYRMEHLAGLFPALFLTWLQISVLAAVSVALSTRFSLVVNLPAVILIYFAGNLTRYIGPELASSGPVAKVLGSGISLILPYLETFDLKGVALMSVLAVPGTPYVTDPHLVTWYSVIRYTGIATVYAVCYVVFVLSAGMWSFQRRELGGGEG